MAKRKLGGEATVDGEAFVWRLDREPQYCSPDGWLGMTVAIRHRDGQREAILQFPVPKRHVNGSSQLQRPQVQENVVLNGIRAAIEAGWEPLSRGRPQVFEVDADGR